jgi:uncharacterized phosphosugar-binding protein
MGAYDDFVSVARSQFDRVAVTQRPAIEQAARWVAAALGKGRFLFAFGTGHSHMQAEEIFYRAGGLARGIPMLEEPLMLHENAIEATYKERESGYAARILSEYPIGADDVLVVVSNGGRNAVPVELALEARARGVRTVAITNVEQSGRWPSRHASRKRLFEVVDVVIDNCGIDGDAAVDVPGFPHKVGPPSSITGMLIINLIVVEAIEQAVRAGVEPEVFISSNTNGDAHNDVLLEKYRPFNKHL